MSLIGFKPMLFMFKACLIAMALFGFQTAAAKGQGAPGVKYQTYFNVRFSYSVCYPKDIFRGQGEPDNADGQKFVSKDGAILLVYGSNNALQEKLEDVYREELDSYKQSSGVVSYQAMRNNWFVVSGRKNNRIIYRKTLLNNDQFKTMQMEYNEDRKSVYDPIVSNISRCFKG